MCSVHTDTFGIHPLTCRLLGCQGLPVKTLSHASLTAPPPAPPLLSPPMADNPVAEATPVTATPVSPVLQPGRAQQALHLAHHLVTHPTVAEWG